MRPLEGVKELRERRMLSQQELAHRAGVSLFTVQRIERGEGSVRPKTGRAIAAALGVGVEDLLPKAPRRSPSEPSFNDVLAEERRTSEYQRWADFVESQAIWWKHIIEARALDSGALAAFLGFVEDVEPNLIELGLQEKKEQPDGYIHTYGPIMSQAIMRFYDVGTMFIEAARARVAPDNLVDLEEFRRNLEERKAAAFGDAAGSGV